MFSLKKILPGMRTNKTAFAVFLCIIFWGFWNDSPPFFACIAAVITMQNSVENSIKVGIDRLIGTLIGALFGAILLWFIPVNSMTISFGIIVVLYLTNKLKKTGSSAIGCIVFLAVTINAGIDQINSYVVFRVLETSLGIVIAVCVNLLIHPPKNSEKTH